MPSVKHYRRTWFALLKEAGIPEEDRHWVQEKHTGKESTRDWTPADWETAIAGLQRDLGQHHDRQAHVREDRPRRVSPESGNWATDRQADYIEDMCGKIAWWEGGGPVAYTCRHFLSGDENELRRENLKRPADGRDRWLRLTRAEASALIKALRKMAVKYPVEVGV